MKAKISIDLHAPDGLNWHFDSMEDGPLNDWLTSVVPRLGPDFGLRFHNATIRIWPEEKR